MSDARNLSMAPLTASSCRTVQVVSRAGQLYELRAAGQAVGRLSWRTRYGSLATADSADGEWTIKRSGFFLPRITARPLEAKTNHALFTPNLGGSGVLALADGTVFPWQRVDPWRAEWAFLRPTGHRWIVFSPTHATGRLGGSIRFDEEALRAPEASFLMLMGWYLLVIMAREELVTERQTAMATS